MKGLGPDFGRNREASPAPTAMTTLTGRKAAGAQPVGCGLLLMVCRLSRAHVLATPG